MDHPSIFDVAGVDNAPQARRAALAVALAPVLVLLAFTAVVSGLIEPDLGVAVFAACTAWLVYALYRYQRCIDVGDDGPL